MTRTGYFIISSAFISLLWYTLPFEQQASTEILTHQVAESEQGDTQETTLPEDMLQEWTAFSRYLTQRKEFSDKKDVLLYRLAAAPVQGDTRICLSLQMQEYDHSTRISSPACITLQNTTAFHFEAEHRLAADNTAVVMMQSHNDTVADDQIHEIFGLYDRGLVQLSLYII